MNGVGDKEQERRTMGNRNPSLQIYMEGLQVPGVILINTCEFTHLIHTTVMCGRYYCLRFSDRQLKHRVKEQAVWSNRAKIGIPVVYLHVSKGSPSFPPLGLQKEDSTCQGHTQLHPPTFVIHTKKWAKFYSFSTQSQQSWAIHFKIIFYGMR